MERRPMRTNIEIDDALMGGGDGGGENDESKTYLADGFRRVFEE
jgi:hypothetical protein